VLVIGGKGWFGLTSLVEVIDTSDNGKECAKIPDFPIPAQDMMASFYQNKVIACGGEIADTPIPTCFVMDESLIWQPIEPLPYSLSRAASSNIADIWWITGGRNDLEIPETSTLIFDGIEFQEGPFLPVWKNDHCQVTVNDTHVFFTEGQSQDTFMFDWETQEWTFLESIPTDRPLAACGMINNPDIGPEILVVTTRDFSTYIFNLANQQWRQGPPCPVYLEHPSYATLEDGLLVAGGSNFTEVYPKMIYKFSSASYEWSIFDDEFEVARDSGVGVAVSEEFLRCN